MRTTAHILTMSAVAPMQYEIPASGYNGTRSDATASSVGVGSCFGYPVTPLVLHRHVNSHTVRSWRLGRFRVEATPYRVCAHCHPTLRVGKPSRLEVAAAYRAARGEDGTGT